MTDNLRLLEALIFASSRPVTVADMAERFAEDDKECIPDLLGELKELYNGRGIELVERNGGYAFRTASDLGDALKLEKQVMKKLSRAAVETLAIIAYHQPVTRAEIESIRGVAISRGTIDILMEAGWVKPGRRKEIPGRPLTWVITPEFLDHFGIESREDLPGMEELKASGLLDTRPAIDAAPNLPHLFEDEDEDAADDDIAADADDDLEIEEEEELEIAQL